MTHIILPTNFSIEVRETLVVFIKQILQKTQDVQFTLLHAYDTTGYGSAMMLDLSEQLEKNALQDLLYEKKQIEAEVPNVQLNTYVGRGLLTSVVNNYEQETEVALMVLPLKGSNMLQSLLMSSKPSHLAENSNVPMLFLPKEAEVVLPKSILFGIDGKPFENEDDFQGVMNICRVFGAKVHFVHIAKSASFSQEAFEANYAKFLDGIAYDYNELAADDVAKALAAVVKTDKPDAIALVERKDSLLQRLFSQSLLDEMLELAQLPLIAINEHRDSK